MKIKLLIIFMFISAGVSAQIQYLGAPNVTVINRGNFKIDSILYLPKRIKAPTDSGALRYQISDSTLYLWTGSQWIKAKNNGTITSVATGYGLSGGTITTTGTLIADTAILSTKAWRQKGDDSLGAIVGTKVNISDTATMLGAYLRKADTTAMIAPYLRKVDTTAMLTPYVRAAGYGLVKSTYTLSSDTAAMATRARVQKGIDSVSALFTSPDTLTLSTRAWRQKGDDSLGAIIGTKATATGTTNYLSKFTGTSALGNSIVYATTSEVGISTPSPTHTLDVNGRVRVRTIDSTATGMNMLYSDADGVIKKAAIPAGGSGTVTSVATGYGLSGGTITTTGTLIADTLNLSTKAWRQKGIDSVASVRVGGTGTLNFVTKWSGTNTITTGQIFDNGINVGINTITPTQKLHINGNMTIDAGTSGYIFGASGEILIGEDASGYYIGNGAGVTPAVPFFYGTSATTKHEWKTGNATSRMILNSSGDLGIGNTSPSYKLDVTGTLRNTTGAAFATSSGNVLVGTTTDAAYKFDVVGTGRFSNDLRLEGNGIKLNFANPGYQTWSLGTKLNTTQFIIGSSTTPEALTFINTGGAFFSSTIQSAAGANFATAGGNVGIGTTAPATKFNVEGGNIRASATTNNVDISPNGVITITSASGATIDNKTGTMFMQSPSQIIFRESGGSFTEWVRVKSTGFGVGVDPTQKLDVDGRARVRTIDSTGTATAMNMLYADATGVIKKAAVPTQIQTAEAVITGNYTVSLTDYFVSLLDLTTASRNVVLPNDAVNGRQLIIFNTSSDATFKWTFTNEDVEDASGAAITTLTDQKSYTMVYYNGKFRVTAIN